MTEENKTPKVEEKKETPNVAEAKKPIETPKEKTTEKVQPKKDSVSDNSKKETPVKTLEREYVIPLRKAWSKGPNYEKTGKAIKSIKQFVAKHMKVEDRDINKVKLDVYFNNDVWFKGRVNPPSKVKVKVVKEGDIVKVNYAETPDYVKFLRARHLKIHQKSNKAPIIKPKEKPVEQTPEQKIDEKEKEKSSAIAKEKDIKQEAKAEKHVKSDIKPEAQPKKVLSRH